MRLNLDTFESVAFSNTRRGDYDFANFSLAVTKDGQYIALAGRNVGYQIYRIDTACGAEYVDQINHLNRCSSVLITDYIQQELELDSMHNVHARDASFEEENKLSLYLGSSPNWKVVSIMPESYTEDTDFQYLALGDSVSSGEGDTEINPATNWKYYRTYTDNEENLSINQPREKCHLSTRSYPYRLGHWMQLELWIVHSNGAQWRVAVLQQQIFIVVDMDSYIRDKRRVDLIYSESTSHGSKVTTIVRSYR